VREKLIRMALLVAALGLPALAQDPAPTPAPGPMVQVTFSSSDGSSPTLAMADVTGIALKSFLAPNVQPQPPVDPNNPQDPGPASTLTILKLGDDSSFMSTLQGIIANGGSPTVALSLQAADPTVPPVSITLGGLTRVTCRVGNDEDGDWDDMDDFQRETVVVTFTSIQTTQAPPSGS